MPNEHERAPMLRTVWGDLATQVAALVREHPALGRRLMFSPVRATHAYAVALRMDSGTETVPDLARRLEAIHPRTLLAQALPGCSARLYGLLDRCGDAVRSLAFYRELHGVLLGPHAGLLEAVETINQQTLSFFVELDALDPLVTLAAYGLDLNVQRARAVDDMLRLLRDQGVVVDETTTGIKARAGSKAFRRHIRRQYDVLAMPDPGFEPPGGLRFARNIGEVRLLGQAYNNCLKEFCASYDSAWPEFVGGSRIYLSGDDPQLVMCLCRLGPRVWWIEQIAGPSNTAVPDEVRQQIEQSLIAAGIQLLHSEPSRCLRQLLDGRATALGDDDDDEEVDLAA